VDATQISQGSPAGAISSKIDLLTGRFLRSFHVLLRSVRLYQRNHPRMTESLEAADRDLRAVLAQVPALSVKVQRDALIATTREAPRNTVALPDLRGELRMLAADLSAAGIASLIFLRRVNLGELAILAHALDNAARNAGTISASRPATAHNWTSFLSERHVLGIQINTPAQYNEETVLAILVGALSGPESSTQAGVDRGSITGAQARAALAFMATLTRRLEQTQQDSPQEAARALRSELLTADVQTVQMLTRAVLQDPPLEGDAPGPYLERISDAVAVEFVRAEYLAKRIVASEVRRCVASLESGEHHLPVDEAGIEARVERFWSSLPARERTRILSGPDAWCLPVPVLRRHLEPLLSAAQRKRATASGTEAGRALMAFANCLQAGRESTRRSTAAGLAEISDLLPSLWPQDQLTSLTRNLVGALAAESSPTVSSLLATVVESLARLALRRNSFAEFESILTDLEKAPQSHSEPIRSLSRRLLDPSSWLLLIEAALASRPLDPALPQLLQRDPARLLDRLGLLLASTEGANLLPAMTRLLRATNPSVLKALEMDLSGTRRQRSAAAVKLLAAAAPERLAASLPRVLGTWDWSLQDLAVSELAQHPSQALHKQVARMFLDLFKDAHLHVLPCMIDLIAQAEEDSAVPLLSEIAAGEAVVQDIFVRIKAVEALGRLHAVSAAPLLQSLVGERAGLTFVHPAGLRAAAGETLALLQGHSQNSRLHRPRTTDGKAKSQFARARRYTRVSLPSPMPANIAGSRGATARVRAIALGGALLETGSSLSIGDSMRIEIHAGFGRIRSTAVVRNSNPEGYGIEFVHMEQEDREKLRRRLSKLIR
jgi:hypothetical protein